MKAILSAAAAGLMCAAAAAAAPFKLMPADPQPSDVKPGLSVAYAYPQDVKTLDEASSALTISSEPGQPIAGLDHRDTEEGENTLTSKRAMNVAARITGYVKLDEPGIHIIDFLTNDGLRATIGGQVVGEYDGRQSCDSTIQTEVEVPAPGWYPVDILYFQRLGTACLHMRMGPGGKRPKWMPDAAFGH